MTPPNDGHATAGRRFRAFFTAACIDVRQQAGAKEGRVAVEIGVREISVIRFERGETFPSDNLERYAAGYAAVAKPPEDPRSIFKRAVDWWIEAGHQPLIQTDETAPAHAEPSPADVIAAIRAAEAAQAHGRAGQRPTSTRNRKRAEG